MSVCPAFYGLYLAYYGSDVDQTWWKCWNFNPIDCIKISLRYAARALRIGQRGKKIFCISMRFRAFRVDWDTLFFSKIFVSAKRKTLTSEASQMRACWSAWLYQSFIKNYSQLSYCSLEIVYAVKDCDSCDRALLSIIVNATPASMYFLFFSVFLL